MQNEVFKTVLANYHRKCEDLWITLTKVPIFGEN